MKWCWALGLVATSALAGSPVQDKLLSMTESERRAVLGAYMRDAGERCGAVNRTMFIGMDGGNAVWNVGCSSGTDYVFVLYGDREGSTKILDCKAYQFLAKGKCWVK